MALAKYKCTLLLLFSVVLYIWLARLSVQFAFISVKRVGGGGGAE